MNDDRLGRQILEIARALRREDPTFLKRFRRLERSESVNVLTVFALLPTGAVLLTVGLATLSLAAWCTGVTALLTSCLIDRRHQRRLGRPPREVGQRGPT